MWKRILHSKLKEQLELKVIFLLLQMLLRSSNNHSNNNNKQTSRSLYKDRAHCFRGSQDTSSYPMDNLQWKTHLKITSLLINFNKLWQFSNNSLKTSKIICNFSNKLRSWMEFSRFSCYLIINRLLSSTFLTRKPMLNHRIK